MLVIIYFPLKIFYFSLFFLMFSPSIAFTYIKPTLQVLRRHWIAAIFAVIVFTILIYMNTIVHPYMLADNRHYLFYIWNKFYGRYWWFRFLMIPLYLVSIIVLYHSISMQTAGFRLIFVMCTIASIGLQQLIEFRYFIIPFMIARISVSSVKFRYLILELIMYLAINALVFYLFSTKEIHWKDYKHIQRIIF